MGNNKIEQFSSDLPSESKKSHKSKVKPEDDFTPLGGYQPKKNLHKDFVIPPGRSKAIIREHNTQTSANSSEDFQKDSGKRVSSKEENDQSL